MMTMFYLYVVNDTEHLIRSMILRGGIVTEGRVDTAGSLLCGVSQDIMSLE